MSNVFILPAGLLMHIWTSYFIHHCKANFLFLPFLLPSFTISPNVLLWGPDWHIQSASITLYRPDWLAIRPARVCACACACACVYQKGFHDYDLWGHVLLTFFNDCLQTQHKCQTKQLKPSRERKREREKRQHHVLGVCVLKISRPQYHEQKVTKRDLKTWSRWKNNHIKVHMCICVCNPTCWLCICILYVLLYLLKTNQSYNLACIQIYTYVCSKMCNIAYMDTSMHANLVQYCTHTSVCAKHVQKGIVQSTPALYGLVQKGCAV